MGTFPPGCAAEVSDATNLPFSLLASGRAEGVGSKMSQYMQCFAGAAPRRHRVLRTLGLCRAALSCANCDWMTAPPTVILLPGRLGKLHVIAQPLGGNLFPSRIAAFMK